MLEELYGKLEKAKGSGRLFVTVTYLDPFGKLQHYWVTEDFPIADKTLSMKHFLKEFQARNPEPRGTRENPEIVNYDADPKLVRINKETGHVEPLHDLSDVEEGGFI